MGTPTPGSNAGPEGVVPGAPASCGRGVSVARHSEPLPVVETHNPAKRWGSTVALDAIDLAVEAGSGAPTAPARITAVRVLATLLRPDSGSALVRGYDVAREPGRVGELIGVTGQ